jgi:hypothetical protein
LTADGDDRWHQNIAGIGGTREPGDSYGSAVTTGDFDGDGFDDLAVGIPGDRNTGGAVGVLFGSDDGLVAAGDQWIHQNQAGVLGQVKRGNAFGAALFAADFDDDGLADLAIGAPGMWKKGAVHVMYGSSSGVSAAGDQLWLQSSTDIRDDAERDDRFGGAL